jgi:K+-transporting ATPase ATPase A chain
MTGNDVAQIVVFLLVVAALTPLLGTYLYRVIEGKQIPGVSRVLGPVERGAYRLLRIDSDREQGWKGYAGAVLAFSSASFAVLYAILRLQGSLPLNPAAHPGMSWEVAFNTAISFVTNTNWQYYAGESTLSYLSQMAGLAVQNFASAAVGIAVMAAVVRGFARRDTDRLGNFWSDLVRITLYALVPIAVVVGIVLGSQGVMQTFDDPVTYQTLEARTLGATGEDGAPVTQTLYRGPVASQVAIKQAGTNGGGYYNSNSSTPMENPSPLSNYVSLWAEIMIAFALTYTFGLMVGSRRQGWAIFAAMMAILASRSPSPCRSRTAAARCSSRAASRWRRATARRAGT